MHCDCLASHIATGTSTEVRESTSQLQTEIYLAWSYFHSTEIEQIALITVLNHPQTTRSHICGAPVHPRYYLDQCFTGSFFFGSLFGCTNEILYLQIGLPALEFF